MSEPNHFFIGWQEKMPAANRRFLRKFLLIIFIAIPLIALLLVWVQQPFNKHHFEFGQLTNITGTYYHSPFPLLIADDDALPDSLSKNILLVGYGKFGAAGIMNKIQKENGNLQGRKITLSGTLIYGDGRTLMELTQETASFIAMGKQAAKVRPPSAPATAITLNGEIIDPKCYFGVMKPAIGKIHKSCAIRCISGGIPPVFRHQTGEPQHPYDYFLVLDQNGETVNKAVLPFVAEEISLKGKTNTLLGWKVIYIDTAQLSNSVGLLE